MKEIKLTQGKIIMVDDDDFEKFGHLKWRAHRAHTNSFYAVRNGPRIKNGKRKHLILAREIMGNPIGKVVDHINHNTLDNQKVNLRICTNQQNIFNRNGPPKNNTSGFRGISWSKQNNKWVAQICSKYLGHFINREDAILTYLHESKRMFGEYSGLYKRS